MGSGNSSQPPLIPDMHLLRAADTLAPYIGLVREAIELGAQLEREETQRLAIRSDYELRMKELDASIRQMEAAIKSEMTEREDLLAKLHEQCMELIKAGATDAALVVNERMMKKFQGSFISDLLAMRREIGGSKAQLVEKWRD